MVESRADYFRTQRIPKIFTTDYRQHSNRFQETTSAHHMPSFGTQERLINQKRTFRVSECAYHEFFLVTRKKFSPRYLVHCQQPQMVPEWLRAGIIHVQSHIDFYRVLPCQNGTSAKSSDQTIRRGNAAMWVTRFAWARMKVKSTSHGVFNLFPCWSDGTFSWVWCV